MEIADVPIDRSDPINAVRYLYRFHVLTELPLVGMAAYEMLS